MRPRAHLAAGERPAVLRRPGPASGARKGTTGVSTNWVTASFMFLDGGTFGALPLTYLYLPKSARAYLFVTNLSKFITFAAAP